MLPPLAASSYAPMCQRIASASASVSGIKRCTKKADFSPWPKICLYYISALVLLLGLLIGTACPAYAEETADSSSSSTSDTTDDDLSLGGDITDAYDKYASGVDSGLDDIKEQYDGVVNDSVLGFVGACTAWIPADVWVVVGLSVGSLVVLGIVSWLKE